VVDGEGVARPKYVTLGQLVGGLRVIKDGVGPDDRVIINGMARVRPGMKVTAQEPPPQAGKPAAATAPASPTKTD